MAYENMTTDQMTSFIESESKRPQSAYNAQNLNAMRAERDRRAAAEAAKMQQQQQTISQMMDRADPFAGQRAQYQTQLSSLMSDPTGAMANNPFFKANAEAGQEAAMRRLRALGMGSSGNAAIELQNNAMANQSGNYFKMADMLGGFAGAGQNPAAATDAGIRTMGLFENARTSDLANRSQTSGGGNYTKPISTLGSYWGG